MMAGLSFLLILGAATYFWSPSKLAFAIDVASFRSATFNSGTEVLFGRITNLRGAGVAGVEIELTNRRSQHAGPFAKLTAARTRHPGSRLWPVVGRGAGQPLEEMISRSDGTFHGRVTAAAGSYMVRVLGAVGTDHPSAASMSIFLRPGRTYRLNIHVQRHGFIFFLPIFSY